MSALFFGAYVVFVASGTAFLVWMLAANEITAKHRTRLIEAVFHSGGDYRLLLRHYDRVSYDRHMRAVMLLRNPFKLYHADLQKALGK